MKLYSFIFTLFTIISYCQHYNSKWYGVDEGLPQNSVKDIIKDKYGFIWLSTDGGIVRYDGTSFLSYNDFGISNLSFKDFLGYHDEIVCFNNYEKDCIVISDRSAKVLKKKYPERIL